MNLGLSQVSESQRCIFFVQSWGRDVSFLGTRRRLLEDKRDKIERIQKKGRKVNRERGFSMIEVLLALAIGGLGFTCGQFSLSYYIEGLGGETRNARCI